MRSSSEWVHLLTDKSRPSNSVHSRAARGCSRRCRASVTIRPPQRHLLSQGPSREAFPSIDITTLAFWTHGTLVPLHSSCSKHNSDAFPPSTTSNCFAPHVARHHGKFGTSPQLSWQNVIVRVFASTVTRFYPHKRKL